ncbi:MAG: hypothetical protein JO254_04705 [Pseudolabrys sp.]|nr:hypothetical protein [Pseudolabrys sp.]
MNSVLWGFAWLSFAGAFTGALLDRSSSKITQYFMAVQDAPVLFAIGLLCLALAWLTRNDAAPSIERNFAQADAAVRFAWIAAIIVGCAVLVIRRFAYHDFALSLDEFMAEFDATIIASGRLLAPVPAEWRDYVPALQPIFRLAVPENAYLISSYLPVNAALRAVFLVLGEPALAGAILAGAAILALYGVARKLWPDRPDAAVVGVVLLVSSSQFLITAATPYAMTAHLALNLVWLWLFLRDTRASHGMAAVVAFAACGLHQVAFHPLFAAPFVLFLVRDRRWKLAAFYSAVYALSVLFWILYWSLLLRAAGAPLVQSADVGFAYFIQRVVDMIDVSPLGLYLMVLNLFRFLAWQSLLLLPLALIGLSGWRSRNTTITCLALGIVATLGVVLLLMPNQGHGWGYRYLHGCLGSFALLAAQGWISVTGRDARMRGSPALALLSSTTLSLLILLPWRAYQVHAFVAPYATATDAIAKSRSDVVIVDFADIWYGADLVRNDPFLRVSPKVMSPFNLDEEKLRDLCGRYDVAVFNRQDAPRFGLRIVPELPEPFLSRSRNFRDAMSSLNCGRPFDGRR